MSIIEKNSYKSQLRKKKKKTTKQNQKKNDKNWQEILCKNSWYPSGKLRNEYVLSSIGNQETAN